jgi:hypothetical protein
MAIVSEAAETKPLYSNDFQQAPLGSVPDEFLVLEGRFAVKAGAMSRYLELPGAPLDTFGLLFGPTHESGLRVSARIHSDRKGRRRPVFGIGVNGNGGFRLLVAPARKSLELYKGDDKVASVPFKWKPGEWTSLRLRSYPEQKGVLVVQGKAWQEGTTEPAQWQISHQTSDGPPAGRPSIWGMPYSGVPIRFDDLEVRAVVDKEKKAKE